MKIINDILVRHYYGIWCTKVDCVAQWVERWSCYAVNLGIPNTILIGTLATIRTLAFYILLLLFRHYLSSLLLIQFSVLADITELSTELHVLAKYNLYK